MATCMACGKTALLTTTFGNVILCKNCGSLVNASAWSSRDFASMDELVTQKTEAIQKATNNNMPQGVIEDIANYFDQYIDTGFVTSINGKAGQTLKVFSVYCIVTTKSDEKQVALQNMFSQFDDGSEDEDSSLISSADVVKGLMTGKMVQTGIGIAVNATLNQEKKTRERRKNIDRLITVGERRIDLRNMSSVEVYSRSNTANGYLRFVPKGVSSNRLYNCEYFFFNNSLPFETKKIKQKVESLKDTLNLKIFNLQRDIQKAEQIKRDIEMDEKDNQQQNKVDAFEEIRKFKQLLDEGIISEAEFNMKKKELLGL